MITNRADVYHYIAEIKKFPDGSRWAVCPRCGKRASKLLPETEIKNYLHKCQGSNCRKEFWVNVECSGSGKIANTNSENLNVKQAEIKKYLDESRWAICPWCGKRALKLQPETEIKNYLHKCQGSKCRNFFWVNVKNEVLI